MKPEFDGIVKFAVGCKEDAAKWRMQELEYDYPWPFIDKLSDTIERKLSAENKERSEITIRNYVQCMYTAHHWCRFKKIYMMNSTFARYLAETEDAPISVSVIRRLPFNSFALTFDDAKEMMDVFPDAFSSVDCVFVKIGIEAGTDVYFNVSLLGTSPDGGRLLASGVTSLKDGDCYETAIRDSDTILHTGSLEEARKEWRPIYRLVINACQYFCASNAEIHDVKVSKDRKPKVEVGGKARPISIDLSEVGFRLGKRFEAMYTQKEDPVHREDSVTWTPRRPHVRRAHWHHYWTGPGRTVLELRWLEPVFVMGDSESVDVVVHGVDGNVAV